jgi:hypothetical protein
VDRATTRADKDDGRGLATTNRMSRHGWCLGIRTDEGDGPVIKRANNYDGEAARAQTRSMESMFE